MATQWFYARGGQQQGPVSFEELQQLAASGQVQGGDLVWSEGMSNWSPASSVANLMPNAPAAPSAPAAPGAPAAPSAPTPSAAQPMMGMVQPEQPGATVGYQGPSMGMQPLSYGGAPPKNYLVQSILVTICCCIPLGIPAIVYAAQVNSKYEAGDTAGAEEASRQAKFWCWLAFGVGLALNVLVGGFRVARQANHW